MYIPYFPYQKWIGIIHRIHAVFRIYFHTKIRCKTVFQMDTPDSGSNHSRNSPFFSLRLLRYALPLLYTYFLACFCINHNVSLVVRVVGLLFALAMAILGSVWLWTGLALQTLIFGATELDTGVQLFKSYKMSLL